MTRWQRVCVPIARIQHHLMTFMAFWNLNMLRPDEISKRPGSFSTGPLSVVRLAGESRDVTRMNHSILYILMSIPHGGCVGRARLGLWVIRVLQSRAPFGVENVLWL